MKRRAFLKWSSVYSSGNWLLGMIPGAGTWAAGPKPVAGASAKIYEAFRNPDISIRPYVRWWWNGDKVTKEEIARELQLLKEAGIGGVEINPIQFPPQTDDLGIPSIPWLSPAWVDMLDYTLKTAAGLSLTADLIVGSGWPFGDEFLQGEERSQILTVTTRPLEGGQDYEFSTFDLFKDADPAISAPYAGRSMELISVKLVPDPLVSLDQAKDLSDQIPSGIIHMTVPMGNFVLYGVVKFDGFSEVINGAPGANGPVLNHYNADAVRKYLNHMSDTIQQQIGPLTGRIRSFFTDSMELEGANWCADMASEFQKRRGYDLMPYLPFILYKVGGMGNFYDFFPGKDDTSEEVEENRFRKSFSYRYLSALGPALVEELERARYDFDFTKWELIHERFVGTFARWCKANKVLSRVQAYGRGYHPLEGSFEIDIPECETWIKYGIGEQMNEVDPRVGRAYTMINKYVSSAAHLKGKQQISCEELTDTDMVFNATLEILKLASDQSTLSGVTHPVFHGFNYSPPKAPFPGWIRYGTFFNEHNLWWPYFGRFTAYRSRVSALVQQGEMFADIAVLTPTSDMWTIYGAQNEPFPTLTYPAYLSLIWESIHQNGNACDYVSEKVIQESTMNGGWMKYGPRSYHTILLVRVERLDVATAQKLHEFVSTGGRVFCLDTCPFKSTGLKDYQGRDALVKNWIELMKTFPDRFVILPKPKDDFMGWWKGVQIQYQITPYVQISTPHTFLSQVRYQINGLDVIVLVHSNLNEGYQASVQVSAEISIGKNAWIWDPVTGERYLIGPGNAPIELDFSPADLRIIVWDKDHKGKPWKPVPAAPVAIAPVAPAATAPIAAASPAATATAEPDLPAVQTLKGAWGLTLQHMDGTNQALPLSELKDLKDLNGQKGFAGKAVYKISLSVEKGKSVRLMNLGRVEGLASVSVNGVAASVAGEDLEKVAWYGRRIFSLEGLVHEGDNDIEISVITVMGNYMKTLEDNPVAQKWTNKKRKIQPWQTVGLLGPVTVY